MARIFNVTIDDSEVYAVGIVDEPAIESKFIAMAKEEPKKILMYNDEKHEITGAVLIPDKPIYRYSEEIGEYYIVFSKEVIESLSRKYLTNYGTHELTDNHEKYIDYNMASVVESWVKTSDMDKSVSLGINEPIGTWFMTVHINEIELWGKIKSGERNGFSVEAFCGFEEIENKLKKEYTMTKEDKKTFMDEVKEIVKEALSAFKQTENVQMEEETVTEEVKEEVQMEEQTEVTHEQSEETVAEEEVQTEEVKMEEEVKEEVAHIEEENVEQPEIETLRAEIETLKQQLNEANEKIVEMSKEPSTKPITRGETTNNFSSTMEQLKQLSKMQPK